MPHSVIQQNIIKFLVTDISATVAPIGVKFCIMVPGVYSALLREVLPGIPQI